MKHIRKNLTHFLKNTLLMGACQIQDRHLSVTEEICLLKVFARGNTAIALIHFLSPEDAAHAARTSPMDIKLIKMCKNIFIWTYQVFVNSEDIDIEHWRRFTYNLAKVCLVRHVFTQVFNKTKERKCRLLFDVVTLYSFKTPSSCTTLK